MAHAGARILRSNISFEENVFWDIQTHVFVPVYIHGLCRIWRSGSCLCLTTKACLS